MINGSNTKDTLKMMSNQDKERSFYPTGKLTADNFRMINPMEKDNLKIFAEK